MTDGPWYAREVECDDLYEAGLSAKQWITVSLLGLMIALRALALTW